MIEFVNVSTILPVQTRGLQVCIADSKPVQILQWQCLGEPSADLVRGVYTEDPQYIAKAISFVQLALDSSAHLVLTPEYSFPYEVLDSIIADQNLWPGRGTLWCFGMQGNAYRTFSDKLDEWTASDRTIVIRDAFDRLSQGSFVDPLIYLFVMDDERLCVLPQFKSITMSDKWNEFEARGLCTSDIIYVFDLIGGSDDRNRFMSIICSDVLGIEPSAILEFTKDKNLILYHAMLNQEPRHRNLLAFRNYFFDRNTGREIRLITLNWADETIIEGLKFNKPWSAFYKKKDYGRGIADERLRASNHQNGTFYALHNEYTEIWYSHRAEHCKLYTINKGYQIGASYASVVHEEPLTQAYYIYNQLQCSWSHSHSGPQYSLSELIEDFGSDYNFPLTAHPHLADAFFGLCFGHFIEGELSAGDDESVARMVLGPDHECDMKRNVKAEQYRRLIKVIKKQDFPLELHDLIDNHYLHVDPQTSHDKYGNVYPKNIPGNQVVHPFQSGLFIISNFTSEDEVRNQVDEICKKLHYSFRNRVVIYYLSSQSGKYTYFDEHLRQTRIDKATFSKSLSSIKK